MKNWLGRQTWQLPGGGVKKNEKSLAAAIRELKEETGIVITGRGANLVAKSKWRTDGMQFNYSVYAIKCKEKPIARANRPEVLAAAWLRLESLSLDNCPREVYTVIRNVLPARKSV